MFVLYKESHKIEGCLNNNKLTMFPICKEKLETSLWREFILDVHVIPG